LDEGALALYGVATFKEMRYRELQQQDRIANSLLMRRNLRRFGAMSCSETISRQGRITLPESYRKRCALENSSSVVVVGIEITPLYADG
jgi:DNA-binding transcriptional regulator/RsmH inhibitor MraZ